MSETQENQIKRVLAEMVASGEVKTTQVNGETHYYLAEDSLASTPTNELQELIDDQEVIKIFREGDIGFPAKYSPPADLKSYKASLSKFDTRRSELIRRFKALL
jgi:hypothetical protein